MDSINFKILQLLNLDTDITSAELTNTYTNHRI